MREEGRAEVDRGGRAEREREGERKKRATRLRSGHGFGILIVERYRETKGDAERRNKTNALVVLEFLLAVLDEVIAPLFQLFLRASLELLQKEERVVRLGNGCVEL